MTPREFDEWMAFRQLEPDPEDRRAEILKRGFAMLAASFSGQSIDPNILDPKPHEEQTATPNQVCGQVLVTWQKLPAVWGQAFRGHRCP